MHVPTVYETPYFPDRHTYLVSLAGEYGVPLRTVKYYASILDDNEDFDALITILEELSCFYSDDLPIDSKGDN